MPERVVVTNEAMSGSQIDQPPRTSDALPCQIQPQEVPADHRFGVCVLAARAACLDLY